jgi:hypothetical protein
MEAGRPSPLKIQISQEGDYKPGFFEAMKKRFVGCWWTAQDFWKTSKISSSFIFNGTAPDQNLPHQFGDAGPTHDRFTSLV